MSRSIIPSEGTGRTARRRRGEVTRFTPRTSPRNHPKRHQLAADIVDGQVVHTLPPEDDRAAERRAIAAVRRSQAEAAKTADQREESRVRRLVRKARTLLGARDQRATGFGHGVLAGLNRHRKHVYGGTVDSVTVEERRAKNRRARKARRSQR